MAKPKPKGTYVISGAIETVVAGMRAELRELADDMLPRPNTQRRARAEAKLRRVAAGVEGNLDEVLAHQYLHAPSARGAAPGPVRKSFGPALRQTLNEDLTKSLSRKSPSQPGKTLLELFRERFDMSIDQLADVLAGAKRKTKDASRETQLKSKSGFVFERRQLLARNVDTARAEQTAAERLVRELLKDPGFSLANARLSGAPLSELRSALGSGGYVRAARDVSVMQFDTVRARGRLLTDGVTLVVDSRGPTPIVHVVGIREAKLGEGGAERIASQITQDVQRLLSGFNIEGLKFEGAQVRVSKRVVVSLLYEVPPPRSHIMLLNKQLRDLHGASESQVLSITGRRDARVAREIMAAGLEISGDKYMHLLEE